MEFEHTAGELLAYKDVPSAREALRLCRQYGGDPPTTENLGMRLLKPLLPALLGMRLQQSWRGRSRKAGA
jgi:hypothetical protein